MTYGVNEPGIKALRSMSGAVTEAVSEIKSSTETVRRAADENKGSLGPHVRSLYNALDEIEQVFKNSTDYASEVAEKLNGVAEAYQDILDDEPNALSGTGTATDGLFGLFKSSSDKTETLDSYSYNSSDIKAYMDTYWPVYDNDVSDVRRLKEINPKYDKNDDNFCRNCQNCVPAYEMTLRGYKVSAKARSQYLSYHPFEVWENPIVFYLQGNGRDDIERMMSEWGDGARAQITVYWKELDKGGHTFTAVRKNGATFLYDPQTGDECVYDYFEDVMEGSVQIARIDNLEPSKLIFEACGPQE